MFSEVPSVLDLKPTGVGHTGSIPRSVKFLTTRHRLATGAALHCGLCLSVVRRQWTPPTRDTRKSIKRVQEKLDFFEKTKKVNINNSKGDFNLRLDT